MFPGDPVLSLSANQKKSALPWRHRADMARKPSMRGLKGALKRISGPYALPRWRQGLEEASGALEQGARAGLALLEELGDEALRGASPEALLYAEAIAGAHDHSLMGLYTALREPEELLDLLVGLQGIDPAIRTLFHTYVANGEAAWTPLRHQVCRLSDDRYAQARDHAAAIWGQTEDPTLRMALAFIFPEQPWGAELLRVARWPSVLLACSTLDLELLRPVLEGMGGSQRTTTFATLAVALDDAVALHLFCDVLEADRVAGREAYALVPLLKMIGAYDHADAAKALAPWVGHKEVGDTAAAFFHTHRHHAEHLTSAAGLKLAAQLTGGEEVGETAPSESLPELLRDRTWRPKRFKPPGALMVQAPPPARPVVDRPVQTWAWMDAAVPMDEEALSKWRTEHHADLGFWWMHTSPHRRAFTPPPAEALERWNRGSGRVSRIEHWFAAHGLAALPGLLHREEEVVSSFSWDSTGWLAAFERLHTPEVVPLLARISAKRAHARVCFAWLAERLELAVHGLLPHALGAHGKGREHAERVLTRLSRMGHRHELLAHAEAFGAEAVAALAALLERVPTLKGKAPKLPAFVSPDTLPRLRLTSGLALSEEDQGALVELLSRNPLIVDFPGIDAIHDVLDPASLDRFHLELIERWVGHKAPSRYDWVLHAVVLLPSPGAVRRVGALVRAWAVSKKNHAARGVVALARLGDDLSLMHLAHIASSTRFTNLKTQAAELLQEAASARGLTLEELGDRTVPTLGLTDGGTVVDYGERRFTLAIDSAMNLAVFDAEGTRIKTLPPKRSTDDADKVAAAKTTFKSLRKHLDKTRTRQSRRLEQAMAARRSWSVEDARTLLWNHALLGPAARGLVWASSDACFRIDESGELVDVDDDGVEIAGEVRVAHPLDMDVAAWQTVFDDYEILQPFQQLGRAVCAPTPAERVSTDLGALVAGVGVPPRKILGWLEARGFRRAGTDHILEFHRTVSTIQGGSARVTVGLKGGFTLMDIDYAEPVEIESVAVEKGLCFGDLHPVAFSELKALLVEYAERAW